METNREGQDQKGMGEDGGKEGMIVTVTYEGIVDNNFAGIKNARVELDASYGEETLLSHPDWLDLKVLFDGEYDEESGQLRFSETLTDTDSVSRFRGYRPHSGCRQPSMLMAEELKNLFGEETLTLGGIFRRTYASQRSLVTF